LSTSVISESSCGTKTTAYPRAPAAPRRLVYRRTTLVEGQPGSPSTVGPRLLGRHPWVPAQKSSTVGPHDQFSLLRALGNQTKLSTFDTVAFRVRRRPDRFHALRRAPPLHSPCQKFGNTDYFLKIPAKATMRGSMKLWEAAQ
jgi:hypothetical protein